MSFGFGFSPIGRVSGSSLGTSVLSITPNTDTTAGGTPVTITGTSLTGATSANLGGVNIADFVVVNDTTITGTTAASEAGLVDVNVIKSGVTYTLVNGFTYT